MNRRGFIASMFALPAAIKALVTNPINPEPKIYPWPGYDNLVLPPELNENILAGDLVYLKDGKVTTVGCDSSCVLGVAIDKPEGGEVQYLMNGQKWIGRT